MDVVVFDCDDFGICGDYGSELVVVDVDGEDFLCVVFV